METPKNFKEKFENDGFYVIDNVFSKTEVDNLLLVLSEADTSKPTFHKTNDLFAIRQFLKEIPASVDLVFNDTLRLLISSIFGNDFFVVKSIYFDKPENSNWFVAYHQDLTISVDQKLELDSFGPWTTKHNLFGVQPPLNILQDNFTIRIHLDNTNEDNGALKVVPKSHVKGIYRPETIDWAVEFEDICNVQRGGVMFMKPLLLHSSGRTINNHKRRVIHIEFSRTKLPDVLTWAEFMPIKPAANPALAPAGWDVGTIGSSSVPGIGCGRTIQPGDTTDNRQ